MRAWSLALGSLVACVEPTAPDPPPSEEGADAVAPQSTDRPDPTPTEPAPAPDAAPEPVDPEPSSWAPPSTPAATIEVPDKPTWMTHRLVPRETLRTLAFRYGVKERSLRIWNKMPETGEVDLKHRRKLRIRAKRIPPPRVAVEHTVAEGETWGQVGRRYGVAPTDLRAYNWSRVGRTLAPGMVLKVWTDPVIHDAITHTPPDAEVRPGAHSVGAPNDGELVNAVKIPEHDDWTLKYPNSAWGTTTSVSATIAALHDFRRRSDYTGMVRLGTMSRQRGREVGGHKSHQTGRDLDVRLPMRAEVPRLIAPTPSRVDWLAVWHLIEAFVETGKVQVIFFDFKLQKRIHAAAVAAGVPDEHVRSRLQWPVGRKASRGIVRHEHGHEDHLHIRFVCGDEETECVP